MSKKIFNSAVVSISIIGAIVGVYLWNELRVRPEFSSVTVKRGNIQGIININGKITPIDSADLGFEKGGKLIQLTHKVGDSVSAGEVLAVSNSVDLEAQLKQAMAQKDSATALLNEYNQLVKKENYKLKSLKGDDTSSANDKKSQKEQVDAQKYQAQAQQALVAAADDNIANIKAQVEKTKIVAPFPGIISRQDIDLGEVAGTNTPVITVIGNNGYKIESYVSQVDADRIKVGENASFTLDTDSGKKYQASVTSVDPAETDVNGVSNYKVTLEIKDNGSDFKSGVGVSLDLIAESKNNALLVPQKAVYSENGDHFIYALQNGLREKKKVETGIAGVDSMVEIVSGLNEGDQILVTSSN